MDLVIAFIKGLLAALALVCAHEAGVREACGERGNKWKLYAAAIAFMIAALVL